MSHCDWFTWHVGTWSGVSAGEVIREVTEVVRKLAEVVGEVAEVVEEIAEVVGEIAEVVGEGKIPFSSPTGLPLAVRSSASPRGDASIRLG